MKSCILIGLSSEVFSVELRVENEAKGNVRNYVTAAIIIIVIIIITIIIIIIIIIIIFVNWIIFIRFGC